MAGILPTGSGYAYPSVDCIQRDDDDDEIAAAAGRDARPRPSESGIHNGSDTSCFCFGIIVSGGRKAVCAWFVSAFECNGKIEEKN